MAQENVQCSLEFLLAGCVNNPANLQTAASFTVEHPIMAPVKPAADLGTGGDLPAGVRRGRELLEGFPETAQVSAGLVLAKPLGGVLADFFEVSGGFGAKGRTAPHPP